MLQKLLNAILKKLQEFFSKNHAKLPEQEIPTPKEDDLEYLSVLKHAKAEEKRFKATVREFNALKDTYKVNTPDRINHFWAQMAHETGGFRWFEELGGKNYFKKYDGRRDLGNTEPGDGYRFKGRGIIHLTGRYNYMEYSKQIGIDLIKNPERAADPDIAVWVALIYWSNKKLNKYSDRNDIYTITRRINGGLNGIADRKRYLKKLRKAQLDAE